MVWSLWRSLEAKVCGRNRVEKPFPMLHPPILH